jgi:hypothetical protein
MVMPTQIKTHVDSNIHVNMSNITWNTMSTCHYANVLPKWHMCVILLGNCISYKLYIYLKLGLSIK